MQHIPPIWKKRLPHQRSCRSVMRASKDIFSFSTPQGTTAVYYYSDTVSLPHFHPKEKNVLYVCDEHTWPLLQQAEHFSASVPRIVLPSGDGIKTVETATLIAQKAAECGLDRQSFFIAFGGGVICDITAFAASLYMRGVRCILVPTTVLAMADAAIGGKTAVNLLGYKNLIGTFYAASSVILCFPVLQFLPEAEYRSGLAEILKTAVLYDPELYRMFERHYDAIIRRDSACISLMIRRAAEAKARVVERDFTEQGERALLNFGHSFAHALESLSHFSVLHGDAVAWGMARALAVSEKIQHCNKNYTTSFVALLRRYGWHTEPIHPGVAPDKNRSFADSIITCMKKDKKNRNGIIRLILQEDILKTQLCEVAVSTIREVLQ